MRIVILLYFLLIVILFLIPNDKPKVQEEREISYSDCHWENIKNIQWKNFKAEEVIYNKTILWVKSKEPYTIFERNVAKLEAIDFMQPIFQTENVGDTKFRYPLRIHEGYFNKDVTVLIGDME